MAADWLTMKLLAEDAQLSINAYKILAKHDKFFSCVGMFFVEDPDFKKVCACYHSAVVMIKKLKDQLKCYLGKAQTDAPFLPEIPDEDDNLDNEPIDCDEKYFRRRLDDDFDIARKCNRHFGASKITFNKVCRRNVDTADAAKISECYEAAVIATRILAKELGIWLNEH